MEQQEAVNLKQNSALVQLVNILVSLEFIYCYAIDLK